MADWTDQIVGARMSVDQEFSRRVTNSAFSNQEWGLIMTATEFEIEHADDPDQARIVANTSKIDQVLPELDKMSERMNQMGGGGGPSGGGGSDGGFLDSVKNAFGLGGSGGGDDHAEKKQAAEELTQEYADELQAHLEGKGRWEEIRTIAAAGED